MLKHIHIDRQTAINIAFGLTLLAFAGLVMAGGQGGGGAFDDVYETLVEWTQGTLGRIIALTMVLVGLVAGVARQSIMAFVIGVAAGMGLYNAPDVIDTVMVATLTNDAVMNVMQVTNGLM